MIQKLIDVGDLKQYVQKSEPEERNNRPKQVHLPENDRTINTISCSEPNGPSLTCQIGKRSRKQFENYCELYKIDGEEVDQHEDWMNVPLTFSPDHIEEDMEGHNDPLVLTLPVSGWDVKKILIDGGSSVNVLFYDTFKRIKLTDEQLMSSYYTIYGFNGAATKPLRDIVLEVKAGPMKVSTRFSIVYAPSPYNAIIGRRWVHKLKEVAATYHQYLRFLTLEGEMQIKGDQVTAREFQDQQNQLNIEQEEQRRARKGKNRAEAKDRAID
ncbi:uncharacterized protein LOC113349979 [Papaver somniferum]|uniref:uncharacterized protein LOC113349979 n=1 Tax=Papaver somniferum TaxID=3469 RepID=UPI000E6FB935|nr:uncharacterized protein LOC113349979 [Papaver somniferum]